jgi:2-keto-3-deoxy-L-rhamnonate aldolase RhmA
MNTNLDLKLVLFENDPVQALKFAACGINAFMIDLEIMGKDLRQLGFDTEIRPGTQDNLAAIANLPDVEAWCRLNRFGEHTRHELESSLVSGAKVILLPMATTVQEVEKFVRMVDQRAKPGIMIETVEGAAMASSLADLPLDCVFFGLNDFAISRGGGSIFKALADGSVETVRNALPKVSFGVAGLTSLDRGVPIPSHRLLEEIHRLGCSFTFLRRSFRRDALDLDAATMVQQIQDYWQTCSLRSLEQKSRDHQALLELIHE